MGIYLNPSNELFIFSANSVPYVDKSGIIAVLNRMIHTDDRYVCVSRPRRFGKTMTANMLSAYYNREYDALELFERLNIAGDDSFKKHLNRYDVIFLDISDLYSKSAVGEMIVTIENMLIRDLMKAYPDITRNDLSFIDYLKEVHATTGTGFIIIIDEWDCVFREKEESGAAREEYLEFLRKFLKDKSYVSLVYMTGILPIKKYISDSALNMFQEFSMSDPSVFAEFTGFTGEEVNALCDTYSMDFGEMAVWYDGYRFPSVPSVYNPRSVVLAIKRRKYSSYWTKTVSFEALQIYIGMNFDGLRESVVSLLAGNKVKVKTDTFSNDMVTFQRKDDILTLLVHLGYRGYLEETGEVFIPNKEITDEFVTAIELSHWNEVAKAIQMSEELLKATWRKDGTAVAEYIASAHEETSHLTYSDENALSYTVSLAYFAARDYYNIIREMPSGLGYADMVFLPKRNHPDKPAMVVELKWNKSAGGAIEQIKEKKYPAALKGLTGKIILVGLNYDRKTKQHNCEIEECEAEEF